MQMHVFTPETEITCRSYTRASPPPVEGWGRFPTGCQPSYVTEALVVIRGGPLCLPATNPDSPFYEHKVSAQRSEHTLE